MNMLDLHHRQNGRREAYGVGTEALSAAWKEIENHRDVRNDDDAKMALDGMLGRMFTLIYNIFGTEIGDKFIVYKLANERLDRKRSAKDAADREALELMSSLPGETPIEKLSGLLLTEKGRQWAVERGREEVRKLSTNSRHIEMMDSLIETVKYATTDEEAARRIEEFIENQGKE